MDEDGAILFTDRREAGRQVAAALKEFASPTPVVIGLPRGGVVVAAQVARALNAPLDVLIAKKLGSPQNEEVGIGAIAPGGVVLIDEAAVTSLGISTAALARIVAKQTSEADRRAKLYRSKRPAVEVRGRTVILVDDGLATGITARAAIRAVKRNAPASLVLAVPVCSMEAAELLRAEVDVFITLYTPAPFQAVSIYYGDFEPTTDAEVLALLEENAQRMSSTTLGESIP